MKLYLALGLLLAVCAIGDAKCKWGKWSKKWSKCSKTCGGGTQYKSRECVDEYGKDCSYDDCKGGSDKKTRSCNTDPCCTAEWGEWGSWGKCKKCYRTRKRPCNRYGCKAKCKPKKDGKQKEKCDETCEWEKTGKYEGPCKIDKHGHCVKYPTWECVCDDYGCGGTCEGDHSSDYELCDKDECCSCTWEKTGYTDCEIDKHGHCVKYPEYECNCDPEYCGECGPRPEPKYVECDESECCDCTWEKTGGYTDCEIDKHGHCVKYPEYECNCDPEYCGECGPHPKPKYVECRKSECCDCKWGEYGECKKYKGRGCQKKRECICPGYCTGECYGDEYKKCQYC